MTLRINKEDQASLLMSLNDPLEVGSSKIEINRGPKEMNYGEEFWLEDAAASEVSVDSSDTRKAVYAKPSSTLLSKLAKFRGFLALLAMTQKMMNSSKSKSSICENTSETKSTRISRRKTLWKLWSRFAPKLWKEN